MDELRYRELQFYERMMTMKPRFDKCQPPKGCKNCEHYQPRWKYRFCYYTICPYKIRDSTIRSIPLRTEHFPKKEVVNMSDI